MFFMPGKSRAAVLWCLQEVLGVFSLLWLRSSLAAPCSANQLLQRIRKGCSTGSAQIL